MKAFKDSLIARCQSELVGPMERELGIKLADYQAFAQGQLTFALLQNDAKADSPFSPLLLVDSKDRSEQLKKALADAKKKWVAGGKAIKTVEIRGVPFTTFITTRGDLSNTLSKVLGPIKPAEATAEASEEDAKQEKDAAAEKIEFLFGQSDSLLIIGQSSQTIEKVLNRQAGGLIPALEEDPAFRADYEARLRSAPAYAWLNAKEVLKEFTLQNNAEPASEGLLGVNPQKNLAGIGILDLKTVSLTWKNTPEGFVSQIFLAIPESNRRGIFKLLTTEAKDAAPPPFVPADATKFMRWRLDLAQTWTGAENLLGEINPTAKGVVSFVIDWAGKSKDPAYNLRGELLGSLGNDIVYYEKAAPVKGNVQNSPSLLLIGSPKADKLAAAINVAMNALSPSATTKTSEFQGRTIYTISTGQGAGASTRFAANGSYVAISTDITMLEEYLRSSETKGKALGETAGLNEAAQKVGGMNTGLFFYEDQREQLKATLEKWQKNSSPLDGLLNKAALKDGVPDEPRQWADFSLLPPCEVLAKYFYYSVSSVSFNAEGIAMNYFAPNPPQANKK